MVSYLLVFQLSGGPPYGLRLQGGLNNSAFIVAKVSLNARLILYTARP